MRGFSKVRRFGAVTPKDFATDAQKLLEFMCDQRPEATVDLILSSGKLSDRYSCLAADFATEIGEVLERLKTIRETPYPIVGRLRVVEKPFGRRSEAVILNMNKNKNESDRLRFGMYIAESLERQIRANFARPTLFFRIEEPLQPMRSAVAVA